MIETRAPGKLFVAGEYAVVDPGEPAVLIAVDRYLTVRLTEATGAGRVHSGEYGPEPLRWVRSDDGPRILATGPPGDHVLAAISAIEELRHDRGRAPRYVDLEIASDLDDPRGRKYGLGSSAAVTVAVVAALDEFYGLGLTPLERFRLALLATITVSPRASGGDVAASTFGGWIRYTSPDRDALARHRAEHGLTATLADAPWAGCSITPLPPPAGLSLLVGWTGSPAATDTLVDGVRSPRPRHAPGYRLFVAQSRACVDDLVSALGAGGRGVPDVIRRARRLLVGLGSEAGIAIETEQLRLLCEIAESHGAAAKSSGAGGGDCGIALAPAHVDPAGILREWDSCDVRPLALSVHRGEGARR
ncbi:phosphomevalonate kinase [Pseudactinotalea sp. HY158]|uniref:phosphomevalonate kinase n=1 Tax=Pseudactinotalea sp. HY158 TaxID=2654547 RepID=UPI00129CEA9B|nr:phosphomevalonate kinase [Pseudactinotalea sp. HY158]QGH68111.1 phosphomevalonate kinase [Pseudactinotalea sp. HY158]